MTSEEKALKAREILNSNPSDDDVQIAMGLMQEAIADNNGSALHLKAQMYFYGLHKEEDLKKAFELGQKALEAGCERAKILLAQLYVKGEGTEKDLSLAKTYLEDMIAKDDSDACFVMGSLIFDEEFPDIDYMESFAYFEKAADLGDNLAMARLGQAYDALCETEKADYWYAKAEAAGVENIDEERAQIRNKDYGELLQNAVKIYFARGRYADGFRILERDTAQGNLIAKLNLAFYSVQGVGPEAYGRDLQRAIDLYQQISAEGEIHGVFMLGYIYCTVKEIQDLKKGKAYLLKAAEAGHADAQFNLALAYCMHPSRAEDITEGMRWLETAAEQDQGDALNLLACCHLQDNKIVAENWQYNPGYEQDAEKGFDYLTRAAKVDNFAALASLARCLHLGKYIDQDDEKAFMLLERSCSFNQHPDNITLLADFYRDGIGTEQNYETAAKLYYWAIGEGNIPALGNLAILYQEGRGVPKDEEKAKELLDQYSEMIRWKVFGILPLQHLLAVVNATEEEAKELLKDTAFTLPDIHLQMGNRYANGDGVEQDESKAAEWWKKAAEGGNANAMYNLGVYYNNNNDMVKALEYMERSASTGHLPALFKLGTYYVQNGKTDAEKEQGITYLTTAAEQGDSDSLHFLVCMYHDGTFTDKDYDKARYWLDKYLETNDPCAHFFLASSYYFGDMYEQDYAKALEQFTIAVKSGYHEATEHYMHMRWWGNHCEQDREEVVATYKKLAEDGDSQAMFQLYLLYSEESYEGRNLETAMDYLQQAVEKGNVDAFCKLGDAYLIGDGVEQNIEKALSLYDLAIERGSTDAVYQKSFFYICGVEGVVEPDYDKAIELLRPYTEGNANICFLMAMACNMKCREQNAYSWELASEATQYLEQAAEGGYIDAMRWLGLWYIEGRGVFSDYDKAKMWLQKYEDNAEGPEDIKRLLSLSDEEYGEDCWQSTCLYWEGIVETNKEKITDWREYVDEEGNICLDSLAMNAIQLGERNAVSGFGFHGIGLLKTDPDKAKQMIQFVCEHGAPSFAERAGKVFIEEGLDNEEAIKNAIEYFNMGIEHGDVGCYLQMGLLFTTEGAGKKAEQAGKEVLEQVCALEGDDWEEERQQARARLEEIEHRPKSFIGKLFGRLRK